ncbi:MAG TPA: hypothetical protein VIH70_06300 [Actinomycetota bacterium]
MIENIPFEIFSVFIGITLVLVGIGIAKQIPALILFAGMFLLTWTVLIDSIDMGAIPDKSVVSGSTTTYTMKDNPFEFTDWTKVIFALFSVVLMLIGTLLVRMNMVMLSW